MEATSTVTVLTVYAPCPELWMNTVVIDAETWFRPLKPCVWGAARILALPLN